MSSEGAIVNHDSSFSEQQVLSWAREGYLDGRADLPVRSQTSALLVIDMQDESVRPGWSPFWIPEATRQIPRIQALLALCRRIQVPAIFTAFAATHGFRDRPFTGPLMPIRNPHVAHDASLYFRDGRICDELAPLPEEIVIHKPSYGAFYDTPLATILRNMGRDTVIICGTLTNFCCGATARQAYERGFTVVFGSDINATDLPEMHEAELKVLRRGFARVMTSAEIMAELTAARD